MKITEVSPVFIFFLTLCLTGEGKSKKLQLHAHCKKTTEIFRELIAELNELAKY